MKKEIKFKKGGLTLNKETLSKINERQMKAIAGGIARAAATSVQEPTKEEQVVAGSNCCSSANTACC
ncbi:class I lanthipeptide [Chryseobacterium sp.]|uniref:class I lanthipeptide n=1 Tax=Chryseobacterium sp. TaxID=1871047 RepID=UPI0025BC9021|nr:class I lanthipeptide [Chryseobacterium sp.]MBV8326778.1 class I lanthipeptide [Chryseobacterium sp.]